MHDRLSISSSIRPTTRVRRSGFTLMELMVVSIILVLVVSMAVPRLTSTQSRGFENGVNAVADLLMMYAHRDAVGAKAVGLKYDPGFGAIVLMVLDDQGDARQAPEWITDPLVRPVTLPPEIDADEVLIFADGELINTADHPLSHAPGNKRPALEVFLQSADGNHRTTLVLAPHAVGPKRSDASSAYASRSPIDLNAAGRTREDW